MEWTCTEGETTFVLCKAEVMECDIAFMPLEATIHTYYITTGVKMQTEDSFAVKSGRRKHNWCPAHIRRRRRRRL